MPSIYDTDEATLRVLPKSDLIGLDSRIHKIYKHDLKNVANDHRLGMLLSTLTKVHVWVVSELHRRGIPHVDGGPPLPKTEKVQSEFGEFVRQANIGSLPAVRISEKDLKRLQQGGASYLILPDILESRDLIDGPMPRAVVINNRSAVGTVRFLGLELPTSERTRFGIRTVERAADWKAAGIVYIPFIEPVTVKFPNGSKGVMRPGTLESTKKPLEKHRSEFEACEDYDMAVATVEALTTFARFKDILDLPTRNIVPEILKPMRAEELREMDELLHDRFRVFDERGFEADEIVAAHAFVIQEMESRKLPHTTTDGLDEATTAAGKVTDPNPTPAFPQHKSVEPAVVEKDLPEDYLSYPPGSEKKLPFVYQNHWRGGKSVHGDMRFSQGKNLLGFTLTVQTPGIDCPALDSEDTATVEAARNCSTRRFKDKFKIDPVTGNIEKQILSFPKSRHPLPWLKFEGVIAPGEIGSTANLPAVVEIIDSGDYMPGARKKSIWEIFIEETENGIFAGRYLWRPPSFSKSEESGEEETEKLLPTTEETNIAGATASFIRPESQLPNVLSKSSRKDRPWISPKGWSALPSFLSKRVPPRLRYWTKAGEAERMRLRNQLFDAWKSEGLIEDLQSGDLSKMIEESRDLDWTLFGWGPPK